MRLLRSPATLARSAKQSFARSYATPAAAFPIQAAKVSKGISVASVDDHSPTAAITVLVPAGPRYEPFAGAAHVLKNLVLRSTFKRSALAVARQVELNGGIVSSSLTREYLLLTAEFLKGDEAFFAELLGDVLTSSRFPDWEFNEDVLPQLEIEYAQAASNPSLKAVEVAHQLAFRNGLGNSLFIDPDTKVPHAKATQYARLAFSNLSGISVVGTGVNQQVLSGLVEEFYTKPHKNVNLSTIDAENPDVKPVSAPSQYFGGHARIPYQDHSYHLSHFVPPPTDSFLVAFPSAPSSKSQSYDVLAQLLGGGASVKWSTGVSPLSKSFPSKVQTFNYSYSDAGLFGFLINAPTKDIRSVAAGALNELKSVASAVKDEDLQRAVANAKFAAAEAWEGRVGRTISVATTAANNQGNVTSLADSLSAFDAVKVADVAAAAKELLKATPTSVAVGDSRSLPYIEELL